MQYLKILSITLFILSSYWGMGQEASQQKYNDCAAIFYNGEMLVNEFSPKGQCNLSSDADGKLSLHTVSLNEEGGTPTKDLKFYVAIRHIETNTLRLYSPKLYSEIKLKALNKTLGEGENIVILTDDPAYNLIHNEIYFN